MVGVSEGFKAGSRAGLRASRSRIAALLLPVKM